MAAVLTSLRPCPAGRRSHRHPSADVRELESRIEGLRHVRDGLWAEVAICQKLASAAGTTSEQQVRGPRQNGFPLQE